MISEKDAWDFAWKVERSAPAMELSLGGLVRSRTWRRRMGGWLFTEHGVVLT